MTPNTDYQRRCDLILEEAMAARKRYKIVRGYFRGGRRTIATGLTLAEAQAHCQNPETSSSTCTEAAGKRRTARNGPWFDGYDQEKPKGRARKAYGAIW